MKSSSDRHGIPILSADDLEGRAEKFLNYFEPECLQLPRLTPLADICKQLQDKYRVIFHFNSDLGHAPNGDQYRGRTNVVSRTIYIDKSLTDHQVRLNFTLAHEIAHFVLHRKVDIAAATAGSDTQISDTSSDLKLDHIQTSNPRSRMEWQANRFAAALLLPRLTVRSAVETKQKELGITRGVGSVFLDRQSGNVKDFYSVLSYLELLYQVSRAAVRIRLRELDILHEDFSGASSSYRSARSLNSVLGSLVGK